ncbi:replication-relaxation family protein [Paenibacillus sp. F411]|uniref:replication-relaxation family protein n=1 Tax=Paenibacillus sp. F411 TaxID=2820239 RepID=UPI001AAF1F0C|nr:replication-relaxation family protein [Paenibacillus sp. F411]
MNARDKAIVADLERFRCLTRDDVAELHFSNVKNPVTQANMVLKRLRRDEIICCSTERRKYIYFPVPGIKKDSAKIGHFLAIVDFYKEIRQIELPRVVNVEPKLGGKGLPEPDVFCIWKGAPWFVEIQRSQFSDRVMQEKMNRYENYYLSGEWEKEAWQPAGKKIFPYVWVVGLGAGKYSIEGRSFKVFQANVGEMKLKLGLK